MGIDLHSFVMADSKKCIGCRVCEMACVAAHSARAVRTVGALQNAIVPRLYLVQTAGHTMPVQCHHCENAPCAKSCPVDAITEQGNRMILSEEICVGCKSCMMACPFGAIELVIKQQIVEGQESSDQKDNNASKCDLCSGRAAGPACVESCPQGALQCINLEMMRKQRRVAAANKMSSLRQDCRVREG